MSKEQNLTPAISVNKVAADYGQGFVIRDIDFDVQKGETFGIIGLNGAGKTTLIKILLGLLEAAEGHIDVLGKDCTDPKAKSDLAYLPEKFEPPVFLTGLEFMRFSLKLYQQPYDEDAILKAADSLSLDRAALSRRVNTYSKGMRQKLGLLGTLMTDCTLMVLDEPMSGLDPRARVQVKDMIRTKKDAGHTLFICSHILADMDEICDRVCVIHQGKLHFVGTPTELRKEMKQDYLERAFLKMIETDQEKAA